MKYDRNKLKIELHKLLGKSFTQVFYFDKYEGYDSLINLPEDVQYIPFSAFSIRGADFNFNLGTTEYAPYFGLGGIELSDEIMIDDLRSNHIDEKRWEAYRYSKIINYEIFEGIYLKGNEKVVIPNGIKLSFDNKSSLYVMNIEIEYYNKLTNTLEFIKGSGLTIFFNEKIIDEYDISKNEPIIL